MPDSKANAQRRCPPTRLDVSGTEAVRAAVTESAPAVRRYFFGMCGDWHRADDLAQGALLKAWHKRDSFDGRASATTWIFAIARNHWRDSLRRRKVRSREGPMDEGLTDAVVAATPTPAAGAARGELARAVAVAVGRLPAEQREALSLRESEGLTFRQIGEMLGIPTATVKSRVRYALTKLAEHLEPFRRDLES